MNRACALRPGRLLLGVLVFAVAKPSAAQAPVWPAPPEDPKIRYVGFLYSEADFGRKESFLSRMKRSLSGSQPKGSLAIQRPFDIYTHDGDRVFVTDGATPAVRLFDRREKSARLVGRDVPGGMSRPLGMGGDGTGRVYVADPGTGRVIVLEPDGTFIRVFGGRGLLFNPVDVAVDSVAGRIYVADSYLHQVVIFDSTGALVGRVGKQAQAQMARAPAPGAPHGGAQGPADSALDRQHSDAGIRGAEPRDLWRNRGAGPGEFRYPASVAVAPDGTLFVSDQMNFRVQAFDRTGAFLRQIGRLGDSPGSFARPKGIAVDRWGHLYVADAAFNNVQVFDFDGSLMLSFGALGHGAGEHWMPLGLAIDRHDRIYVADRYNNRAAIYQYLPAPEKPNGRGGPAGPGAGSW